MVALNAEYRLQLQDIAQRLAAAMPAETRASEEARAAATLHNTINELIARTEAAKREAGLPPASTAALESARLEILEGQVLNMSPKQDAKGLEPLLPAQQMQQLENHIRMRNFMETLGNEGTALKPKFTSSTDIKLGTLQSPSIVQPPTSNIETLKR